jgi:NAD+ kinase
MSAPPSSLAVGPVQLCLAPSVVTVFGLLFTVMGAVVGAVGLVLHPQRDSQFAVTTLTDWARARRLPVLGLKDEVDRLECDAVAVTEAELVRRSTLVVGLGGDGTVLRALRLCRAAESPVPVPVLGVNLGKLGFLAEIDVPELPDALTAIDEHRFRVERRSAVQVVLPDGTSAIAFNDVALVRVPGDGVAVVEVRVSGEGFVRYAADAVVVATPTGSTAYSYAAGGPIVSPSVEGLLVIPAAPHASFNRALLLAADEPVTLDLLPSSGVLAVEIDGRVECQAGPGDSLSLSLVREAAHLVRLGGTSFYQRARRKLRVMGSLEADEGL